MVGIIDYKAGNSHSVLNACEKLSVKAALIVKAEDLSNVSGIILPGVGSAAATMDSLKELGLIPELERLVFQKKIPFLGICVGLQILFEHSEEGNVECLGWLKGKVIKFDQKKVRVPQIGWNKLEFKKQSPLLQGLQEEPYFYFVNSYHAVPEDRQDVLATAEYEQEFTAMAAKDNIYASQCHIEKSGSIGLKVLQNFACIVSMNKKYCLQYE